MVTLTVAALANLCLTGCEEESHALLLKVTAESRVDSYTLRVLNDRNETLFETSDIETALPLIWKGSQNL